jgi:hypothetical protein
MDDMRIKRLEYFWGLFDSPDNAMASEAKKNVRFDGSQIPDIIQQSFKNERIIELNGNYGLPGIGEPTEVDSLTFEFDGNISSIRVLTKSRIIELQIKKRGQHAREKKMARSATFEPASYRYQLL